MGCCDECTDCCVISDTFTRVNIETLTFSSQSTSGDDYEVTMDDTVESVQAGDTIYGESQMDYYDYYYYVKSVSGAVVTVRFLYSEGEWESASLDPDPETQSISSFNTLRLGSSYYTNETPANYMYGVTEDGFLVNNSSSPLFITDADGLYSYTLVVAGKRNGLGSSDEFLRIRSASNATSTNYNETKILLSDCTTCEADYKLTSTLVQGSTTTEVCPPNINDQGILPASDGTVYGDLKNSEGLVHLKYCVKQQYETTGSNPDLSTEKLSFVAMAGPGTMACFQNGTAYGDGTTGMGNKTGIVFDSTVKVDKVELDYTDVSDPRNSNPYHRSDCNPCITWQCSDSLTRLPYLNTVIRDDTGLLVIDGTASFDGSVVTVGSNQTVKLAAQLGTRSMSDPDGTINDNFTMSPIRIGTVSDIEVTGRIGDSVTHGWTIVFGDHTGAGGSVNGESYPIKAGKYYHMRWCSTFQDINDRQPVATKHFVQNGFVKEVEGETIY